MKDSNKQQIVDSVTALYEARQEKKQFDSYYDSVNKKESVSISNYIFCNHPNDSTFDITLDTGKNYYSNKRHLKVTRITQKKIIWNTVKLKKKMREESYKKVVKKEYVINDMQSLVAYLKTCNVNPRIFKSFIDVNETIDEKLLEQLHDTGKIKKSEIDGCFEVKIGEPFIKITETK